MNENLFEGVMWIALIGTFIGLIKFYLINRKQNKGLYVSHPKRSKK